MATTPKITSIVNYLLKTTLPLINSAGVYNNTLATMSKEFVNLADMNEEEFPAAFLLSDGANQFSPMTAGEYATGGDILDITLGSVLRIVGYVKLDDPGEKQTTGLLQEAMDALVSDIILATHTDRELGGNVDAITLLGKSTSLEYWQQNKGIVEVWFSLKYDFNPTPGTSTT